MVANALDRHLSVFTCPVERNPLGSTALVEIVEDVLVAG